MIMMQKLKDRQEVKTSKLLIRCPKCARENYSMNVASGICTWCGYNGNTDPEFKGQ